MLTEAEKYGISELLSRLSVSDLQSLAQTVTSKLLVPETSSEAITAIILHTDKAVDLLKRKKIKKEILFKYLHFKRVPIEAVADKSVHVSRVLEVWGTAQCGDMTVMDENSLDLPPAPVPSRNTSHTSLCSLDLSVSRDQLYNRGLELRRSGSSTSIMNCDENSCSSFSFSREKAAKKDKGKQKAAGDQEANKGMTKEQRMARDAERMREKQAKKAADAAASSSGGGGGKK